MILPFVGTLLALLGLLTIAGNLALIATERGSVVPVVGGTLAATGLGLALGTSPEILALCAVVFILDPGVWLLGVALLRAAPDTPTVKAIAWEAPQTLLGALLLVVLRASGDVRDETRHDDRRLVRCHHMAVSLGHFVFWTDTSSRQFHHGPWTRDHELGHAVQSRRLGPAYLPLVGLPSLARLVVAFAYRELTGRRWQGYFDGWPERQADALGGADRPPDPEQSA